MRWAAFGCIRWPSGAGKSEIPVEVVPRTIRLANGDWRAEVVLERHRPDGVRRRTFPAEGAYGHEAEAMEAALDMGRQVLDVELPGSSVEDL